MRSNNLIHLRVAAVAGILAAALYLSPASWAAPVATATGTANATIVTPISILAVNTLEFGQIIAPAANATVTVSTAGARSSTDTILQTETGVRQATFTVSGQAAYNFTVTLPSAAVTLNGPSGATMTVDTFTSDPNGTGTLDGTGNKTLNVGATLHVGGSQAAGSYTGSFDVTVNYN